MFGDGEYTQNMKTNKKRERKKRNKDVEMIKRIIQFVMKLTHTPSPRMFTGCAWAASTLASMAVLNMFIEVLRALHT